jgi:hypothetical protein
MNGQARAASSQIGSTLPQELKPEMKQTTQVTVSAATASKINTQTTLDVEEEMHNSLIRTGPILILQTRIVSLILTAIYVIGMVRHASI